MKKSVNPVTDISPLQVGAMYAATELPYDKASSDAILTHIGAGRHSDARLLMDKFTRPEFLDGTTYMRRKQFTALVSKVPFSNGAKDRKERAISAFKQAEVTCKLTNFRLKHPDGVVPDFLRDVLALAKKHVEHYLGPLDLEKIFAVSRPGSGVAVGSWNRFRVSLPYKIGATDVTATPAAAPYVRRLLRRSPLWLEQHCQLEDFSVVCGSVLRARYRDPVQLVHGNRVTFVPKDARSLRTIAIEPAGNMWLQLGVHEHLAKRLAFLGNSIHDQSRNQELARQGSLMDFWDGLATVDLSAASDSLSLELCEKLMPWDWFAFLHDIRSPTGDMEGETIRYEKYASMGNGTTFVIETIIFLSLARAIVDLYGGGTVSCYGDDIIIPNRLYGLLVEVFDYCGFTVNSEKSYVVGRFRESCGHDWHNGKFVTPTYVRHEKLRHTDLYQLANADVSDSVTELCLSAIRKTGRLLSCPHPSDPSSCLRSDRPTARKWDSHLQRYVYLQIQFVPEKEKAKSQWAYLAALLGGQGDRYTLRGRGLFRHSWGPG